jgi:hypothetical protein
MELRMMATGPHPSPAIRASYADYAGRVIEEVLLVVGDALGPLPRTGWFPGVLVQGERDRHRLRPAGRERWRFHVSAAADTPGDPAQTE